LDPRTDAISGRKSLASLMPASWNQIALWLRQLDGLRSAA
jgi:hypothetical protein